MVRPPDKKLQCAAALDGPLCAAATPSERRSNSRRSASVPSARDRSRGTRLRCRRFEMPPGGYRIPPDFSNLCDTVDHAPLIDCRECRT